MSGPCKDCPDRRVEPNCHMDCGKYLAYQQECRKMYEARLDRV